MDTDNRVLLDELRIGREERDEAAASGRNWWAVGVASLVGLGVIAGGALFFMRSQALAVELATAAPPSSGTGQKASLQAAGYVTARREATASAQITGTLTQVLIEEGEHVQAGQVLARLDDTAARAALEQSQAQVNASQALLDQYEGQLEQARSDFKRDETLVGEAISQQVFDTARTQVRTLSAQVASQRGQLQLARAALKGAQVQLDYTVIKAPFAGVITAKAAQPGEIVSPMSAGGGFTRTGVGTIVDMDSLEIDVDVNEAYLNRIRTGQPAQAVLDAYSDWNIPAHVVAIVPTADRNKATVKVRVAIDLKDPRILPDMGVRVSFLDQADKSAAQAAGPQGVLVPATAIVERKGKSVVFSVDGQRAHAQSVTAGQSFGDLRLVQGIGSGTRVVRVPPTELEDGVRVSAGK